MSSMVSGAGPAALPPLSPSSREASPLGLNNRHRHCSCRSQPEFRSIDVGSVARANARLNNVGDDTDGDHSPANSFNYGNQSAIDGGSRGSPRHYGTPTRCAGFGGALGGAQTPEGDIQAYVEEVTKELATEIKSEIREVISQVEDVLSESTDLDTSGGNGLAISSGTAPHPLQAVQAPPVQCMTPEVVAEYLMEVSRELASEMKSEIREVVSAVDELMSESPGDDGRGALGSGISLQVHIPSLAMEEDDNVASSDESEDTVIPKSKSISKQDSTSSSTHHGTPQSADISPTDIPRDASPEEGNKATAVSESVHSNLAKAISKESRGTMSISSQDSGINLTLPDILMDSANPLLGIDAENKNATSPSAPVCQRRSIGASEGKEEVEVERLATARWHCPPKNIWKPAVEAIQEFDMIRDGDHVLVCLSGGKDSLSLLHTLHQYQFHARAKGIRFVLGAATVDPGSSAYDPRPLIPYLKYLAVPYFYEEQKIIEKAATLPEGTSVCSFCSRMKRGRLYASARREGYNVLALGQHLDDLVESFLMSVFHNGRLRTMKANYRVRERDLRVIRPFVYVREKSIRQFAEGKRLPIIPENCPMCFEAPKERHRTKQLLAQQEILFPRLFWSLRSALHPLMSVRRTGVESRMFSHIVRRVPRAEEGSSSTSDSSDNEEDEAAQEEDEEDAS